jgi:hypothetical protein
MVLSANALMGDTFHGIKSYTDKVHIDEKTGKTEKDHGFSPKTKKVKILDKTENSNVGENTVESVINDKESSNTDKNKDRNKNRDENKNKDKSNKKDSKNSDTADSSSGPSSFPLPTEMVEDEVVLDSATASDRTKQIKLLVLLKILKKFEVTNCIIFYFISNFFFFIVIISLYTLLSSYCLCIQCNIFSVTYTL